MERDVTGLKRIYVVRRGPTPASTERAIVC